MKAAMAWTGWLVAGVLVATAPVVAEAGDLITGEDVKDGSLTGQDLRRGSVTGSDVTNGSLRRADLAERIRPPKSQVYRFFAFEEGPAGGSTHQVAGFADNVAKYTLVEAIDIELDVSSNNVDCHNGTGDLKLGSDVIAQYSLNNDQVTMSLESGDTGSQSRTLVFFFTCTDEGDYSTAGSSVYVTYQLTHRDLTHVIDYEN
jgi:hypothetical protein